MITCVVVFVLQIIEQLAGSSSITREFGLTPALVTHRLYLWQLVTYIFLHVSFFHILFNMIGLYMFGSELEQFWGTREFTKYFFICGIGAALTTVVAGPNDLAATIGASGAIFGILLAYGLLFPNRIIYLYMVIPIPAKWFVIIIGAITFLSSMSAGGSGIAYLAHLGGMLFGLFYLRGGRVFTDFKWYYDKWRRNRLRRKFEVYYNDRHREDDEKTRWKN